MNINSLKYNDDVTTKLKSYLNFSFRTKEVVIGFNSLSKIVPSRLSVVLLAGTLGDSTRKKLITKFDKKVTLLSNIDDLGELVSRPGIKVLGVKNSELGKTIQELLNKKENLPE